MSYLTRTGKFQSSSRYYNEWKSWMKMVKVRWMRTNGRLLVSSLSPFTIWLNPLMCLFADIYLAFAFEKQTISWYHYPLYFLILYKSYLVSLVYTLPAHDMVFFRCFNPFFRLFIILSLSCTLVSSPQFSSEYSDTAQPCGWNSLVVGQSECLDAFEGYTCVHSDDKKGKYRIKFQTNYYD